MGKVSHAQASYVLRSPKMVAGPASLVISKWIRAAFAIATKLHLGNTSLNGSSFTRFSTKSALPVLTLYTKVRFFGYRVLLSFHLQIRFIKTSPPCMLVSLGLWH